MFSQNIPDMSIIVENITKFYGLQKALNNVSFTIRPGEIGGFIGPNGAGKSTLMKIITGYIAPYSGFVKADKYNVQNDVLHIRKILGYLPEHNPLYMDMYVREYLAYVAGIYKLRKKSAFLVDKVIEETGIGKEANKKISMLSKGYRQRVGLAQAILHDPKILILDEPTSGLDPNQIIEIRELISRLGKEKTVLLSTHIMQEVEAICDRIIIIDKGKIVADDSAENMLKNEENKTQTIIVEFDTPVEDKELMQIEDVNKVVRHDKNTFLLQSAFDKDIRADVFAFAVKKKISVLSLQKKEKRLEEVFQELTREK